MLHYSLHSAYDSGSGLHAAFYFFGSFLFFFNIPNFIHNTHIYVFLLQYIFYFILPRTKKLISQYSVDKEVIISSFRSGSEVTCPSCSLGPQVPLAFLFKNIRIKKPGPESSWHLRPLFLTSLSISSRKHSKVFKKYGFSDDTTKINH